MSDDDDWDKSTDEEEDLKKEADAPKPQKKQESSDDDWDNDDANGFSNPVPSKAKWEGEDEEVEEEVFVAKKRDPSKLKPKQKKALKMKKKLEEERRKNMKTRQKMLARQKIVDDEIDPVTRRLMAKKLAEEADKEICCDLFGGLEEAIKGPAPKDTQAEVDSEMLGMSSNKPMKPVIVKKTKIEDMPLKNRKDIERLVDMVAKKMESTTYSRSQKKFFIDKLMPKLCKELKLDDMNSIKKGINLICNAKAKDPNKKKKKGFGKKSIAMRSGGQYQDYSMFDDFDSYM